MIVFIVCVGVALIHILMLYIKNAISSSCDSKSDFNGGIVFGVIFSIVFLIEVLLLSGVLGTPTPTAMDVYQGKTILEYKMVDGVKTDSMVIFKKDLHEKD